MDFEVSEKYGVMVEMGSLYGYVASGTIHTGGSLVWKVDESRNPES